MDSVGYSFFPDFTFVAENFARAVRETIKTEWKTKLDFLRDYDRIRERMRDIVDMPESRANLLLRLVLQNDGRLSARKRGLFPELSDDEVAALERAECRGAGRLQASEPGRAT